MQVSASSFPELPCPQRSSPFFLPERRQHLFRGNRQILDTHANGIVNRIGHGRCRRHAAGFADPFGAIGSGFVIGLVHGRLDGNDIFGGQDFVIPEVGIHVLALFQQQPAR